jgi:hypothetical protein
MFGTHELKIQEYEKNAGMRWVCSRKTRKGVWNTGIHNAGIIRL